MDGSDAVIHSGSATSSAAPSPSAASAAPRSQAGDACPGSEARGQETGEEESGGEEEADEEEGGEKGSAKTRPQSREAEGTGAEEGRPTWRQEAPLGLIRAVPTKRPTVGALRASTAQRT